MELFYVCQLGFHCFSIFESLVIKGKSNRKFYEFLLHHFIATSLILFSLLTNILAVGIVILFLHDISDMTADICRCYVETKYRKTILNIIFFLLMVGNWFYMRMIVLPFCAVKSIYDNLPTPEDEWKKLWFPQFYIVVLCYMLIVMHFYWWFYMMKGGIMMLLGKGMFNPHDKGKLKK